MLSKFKQVKGHGIAINAIIAELYFWGNLGSFGAFRQKGLLLMSYFT